MMKFRNFIMAALAAGLSSTALSAQDNYRGADPVGTVSYCLPRTVITLEVEAARESFHAGPYAAYASKYLGIEAPTEDSQKCSVISVKMTPYSEADQESRFNITPGKSQETFLALTSQGLVSFGGSRDGGSQWRFPSESEADFTGRGVSSNYSSQTAVLHQSANADRFDRLSVSQTMVVEKSIEARAKEAAEMIFNLREKRLAIVTGDTDATFSGEALASAVAELARLEQEYMSLFVGYTDSHIQKMNYDVIPEKGTQDNRYVAFRISDENGLVASDDLSGRPYFLEVVPQSIRDAAPSGKGSAVKVAYYRIPAACSVVLTDGVDILFQSRMPVYQLGVESSLPLQ